ncbi:lipid A biosynthesis acyltransferase [Hirschia litorea]|uniref:Lipid A biosynthesis acyltransferase n=1 Tax=Hirschia litorea TaxID=1199156 RepID=A0ABW2IIC4_9PROT
MTQSKTESENWASQSERGTRLGILISAGIYKIVGRRVSMIILAPVVFFFYLTGGVQRRASRAYLNRAYEKGLIKKKPSFWTGFVHFMAFTGSMLDKLASWTGEIDNTHVSGVDGGAFDAAKKSGRGGLVLTGHLGNPELIRAVATVNRRFSVTVLMHTQNAQQFNSVINQFSDHSSVRLIQVSEIDISVAMQLSSRVEAGEWVVMAADRPPPRGTSKESTVPVQFLGAEAQFPIGPYILGAALKCPTFFLSCIRTKSKPPFSIMFRPFADPLQLPRRDRADALQTYAQRYASLLEEALQEAPMQWFNFFDFWNDFSNETSKSSSDKDLKSPADSDSKVANERNGQGIE